MRKHFQILPFFFSLGLHGLLASVLLLPVLKIPEKSNFTVEVKWESAPVMESALPKGGGKIGAALKSELIFSSIHPSTSVPPGPTLRTNGVGSNKPNNINVILPISVRPERSCEAAKSKDRMVLHKLDNERSSRRIERSAAGLAMTYKENSGKTSSAMGGAKTTAPSKKSHQPLPKYPRVCRKRGQEGRVSLLVQTNGEGQVIKASLHKSSGHAFLDQAALNTVKTWVFPDHTSQKILSFAFRLKG